MGTVRSACFLALSLALLVLSAVCAAPQHSRTSPAASPQRDTPTTDAKAASAGVAASPGQPVAANPNSPTAAPTPTPQGPLPAGTYRIEFKFHADAPLYYVIENEFRDSGGVPPLLSFTTTVKERRFITQKALPSTQPGRPGEAPGETRLTWECDRYEARESGMKEESIYDSLRHTYPPPALRNLASIPGSICTFIWSPAGRVKNLEIKAGTISGPAGRGSPTKTTERCALNVENMTHLLEDLGAYFFPQRPVRVGEEWTRSYVDTQKTFGTVTTLLRCKLRSVRPGPNGEVAVIELKGDITLQSNPPAAPPTQTSRPGQPAPPPPPPQPTQREFKIERAVCTGTVEFNLDRGELLRLDLLRELAVSADIDMKQTTQSINLGPMKLKSGNLQHLRVTTSQRPSPRPIIVGGPKPPPVPPDETPLIKPPSAASPKPTSAPATSTMPAATTRRATPHVRPTGPPIVNPKSLPPGKRGTAAYNVRPGEPANPRSGVDSSYRPPYGSARIQPPSKDSTTSHPAPAPASAPAD